LNPLLPLRRGVHELVDVEVEARYEQIFELLRHSLDGEAGPLAYALEDIDLLVEKFGSVEAEPRYVISVPLQAALQQVDVLPEKKLGRNHEWLRRLGGECIQSVDDIEETIRNAHEQLAILRIDSFVLPDPVVEAGRGSPPDGEDETQGDGKEARHDDFE
jgi:hypothetical protein